MKLIDWSRLDGLGVVGNFICRRVMPCQKRVHSAYEYAGSVDLTRMRPEILEKAEVQQLLNSCSTSRTEASSVVVIGCKPSSWGDQHLRYLTDYFSLAFVIVCC